MSMCGGLVHSSTSSKMAPYIRWATRSKGERKTFANHTALMLDDETFVEAVGHARLRDLREIDPNTDWVVTVPPFEIDEIAFTRKAISYVGRRYGYLKILEQLGDHLIGDRYFFRKIGGQDKYPICSWLAAHVYWRIHGYEFGVPAKAASPDDIADHTIKENWDIARFSSRAAVDRFLESVA